MLDLVLWVCLWPVAVALEGYLVAKRKTITGEPHEPTSLRLAIIVAAIWLTMGVALWRH